MNFLKETLENMEEMKRSRSLLYLKEIFLQDREAHEMARENDISVILTSLLSDEESYTSLVNFVKTLHHDDLPSKIVECVAFLERHREFAEPVPFVSCTEGEPAAYIPTIQVSSVLYNSGQYIDGLEAGDNQRN